jgi:putative endopeptidase
MKWNDIEIEETLYYFLKQMDSLFIENDIYKFFAFLISNGFGNIISINIEQFIFNPKKKVITLDAFSQTFPIYYYNNKKYAHYLKFYSKFLKEIFKVFHKSDISNIIEIEEYLTKIMKDKNYLRKTENTYFLWTNEECKRKCNFDWVKLLKYLGFDNIPNKIIIHQPEYIKQMMIYLKNWNSEYFRPFWTYKILATGINFHSKLYQLGFIFNQYNFGNQKIPTNSDKMLNNVKAFMSVQLNKMYNENYAIDILFCKNIIDVAIKILIKRLTENSWLSKETIEKAIEKIKHIKIYIAHKPKVDKQSKICFTYNMLVNYIILNKTVLKDSVQKLNHNVFSDTHYLGDMNSYEVNANYSLNNNSIFIPSGLLQKPFVTENFIHTLAFLGIIICHELIHALDDEGCKYDKNGVYNNWWKKEDKENYKKIEKRVLELFKHYSKNNTKTEELKMGENIADICSIKIVEDILDYYLDKNNIVDKEKYFKQFYNYYATLYRTQNYKTYYELVNNDYHSYGKYRINCILANSKNFRKYFKISHDDKMYHTIIDIW